MDAVPPPEGTQLEEGTNCLFAGSTKLMGETRNLTVRLRRLESRQNRQLERKTIKFINGLASKCKYSCMYTFCHIAVRHHVSRRGQISLLDVLIGANPKTSNVGFTINKNSSHGVSKH